MAVYAKDKPRGGLHQQGNVAHVVTGVSSPFDLVDQVEYLFVRVLRARALHAADSNGASDPVRPLSLVVPSSTSNGRLWASETQGRWLVWLQESVPCVTGHLKTLFPREDFVGQSVIESRLKDSSSEATQRH